MTWLHLIEDYAFWQPGDETIRVALRRRQRGGLVQREILRLVTVVPQRLSERGLARLPWPLQIYDRRVPQRGQDLRREISPFHGGYSTREWLIFNHNFAWR
jgi:hypothetical protein